MIAAAAVHAAASAGPDPVAVAALFISLLALIFAGASTVYTRRQAVASEKANEAAAQANRLETSARLRVIVRNRQEILEDGMLGPVTTRWEIQNVGRVTARRVQIALVIPGYHPGHLELWKIDEIPPGGLVIRDSSTPYVPSQAQVTLAKAERGLDSVFANAEWRDDREGRQQQRIEVEHLEPVYPERAEGEHRPA